jgi:predicted amidohydrolase YtcJ
VTGLLVRDAELNGLRRADVRVRNGIVTDIARTLEREPTEPVLDARGGALLPGLCDHHLHLHALAAQGRSVPCGPPQVRTAAELRAVLARARADDHGWVRGTGYHESVAGSLDMGALDDLHRSRPVRIQHRGGALWMVNGLAATALGLTNHTGQLWRADDWLRTRLPESRPPDLADTGARFARLGITAVTDATPDLEPTAISSLTTVPQRVLLLGVPLGRPATGPYKIVVSDTALPAYAELADRVRAAHDERRAVAVHCVTREALVLLLAVLDETGVRPGDRIEHAALVPAELLPRIAELGLRIVTQPGFLAHRGDDYLREVPAVDQPDLYRLRSLIEAGIRCTPSSDAPYGPLDPWAVIRAATRRETPSGRTVGAGERITAAQALAGYLSPQHDPGGPPRKVGVGATADLVLLHVPLAQALDDPSAELVRATMIGGTIWRDGT